LATSTEITNVRIALGTLFLALLGTAAFGADVYRSTAPDGSVSFSDRPQGADAQFVFSATPSPAPRSTAPSAPTRGATAQNAATAPPEASVSPTPPQGPSSAELREQRQKNCEIARERQERYTLSRRLFRTNDAGEREFLDDAAVAEANSKAAADVEDWCD